MNDEILNKIEKTMEASLDDIDLLSADERKMEIENLDYLNKMRIETLKTEHEIGTKKDKIIGYLFRGIEAIGIPVISFITLKKCLKFEETGTICSPVVRDFISKKTRFFK